MVGVPRSKGCRTCVSRRVRCDQSKPVCNNCTKGNRECHYSEGLKVSVSGSFPVMIPVFFRSTYGEEKAPERAQPFDCYHVKLSVSDE